MLPDSKADLLLFGNAERAIVEIAHRLAARQPIASITDVRGTAFVRRSTPEGWFEIDSTEVDAPGKVEALINPYMTTDEVAADQGTDCSKQQAQASSAGAPGRRTPPGRRSCRPDGRRSAG